MVLLKFKNLKILFQGNKLETLQQVSDHLLLEKVRFLGSLSTVPSRCIGPSFNCSPQIFAIFDDLGYVVPLSDKYGREI